MTGLSLPTIDLAELAVPFADALTVREWHAVPRETLALAQARFVDHLVVSDEAGQPIGFIPTAALQNLTDPSDWPGHARLCFSNPLPVTLAIDLLLEAFESRAISPVIDSDFDRPVGFITFSDLNKHPVRSAMYPLFAELEAHLATLIERKHTDPWVWITSLDRDRQARIVGYWELSRRDGVDIGPIAGATLTELFTIVKKDADLRNSLGFNHGGKWDSFAHGIADLRNLVMHPVRPMFSSVEDLSRARQRLTGLAQIVQTSKQLLKTKSA